MAGPWPLIRQSLVFVALAVSPARADAPQALPMDYVAQSPNGHCVARAEFAAARVTITGLAPGGLAVSWSVPGWHRALVVGDDCRLLGIGYSGQNLLSLDDRGAETPVMAFHREGGLVRVVRVGELYPDLTVLRRTVSH